MEQNTEKMEKQVKITPEVKKYQCCIPGCPTYDTAHNFLRFPMDCNWRQQWLAAVPRKNWVIDHSTVVCLKHFRPDELAIYSKVMDKEKGGVYIYKTATPLVKEGAVPSIYFNPIPKKKSEIYTPSVMFEIEERDQGPQTFADVEDRDISDFLIDYLFFSTSHEEKLINELKNWHVLSKPEYVVYYILDADETPKIITSVKIANDFQVSVTLGGREMDSLDLTWIIPITGKVNRWSQLKTLLNHFANSGG